jgi:hypothetical protein
MSLGKQKAVYNTATVEEMKQAEKYRDENEGGIVETLFDNIISSVKQERLNIECRIDYLSSNNARLRKLITNVVGEFHLDMEPVKDNTNTAKEPHTKADRLAYEIGLLHTRIDTIHRLNQEYNSLINTLETIL